MTSQFDAHFALAAVTQRVHAFLNDLVGEVRTLSDGRFIFREGSTQVIVQCRPWEDIENTVVDIKAPVVILVPKSAALYEFVAERSNAFPFARIWTEDMEEGMSSVFAGWNLMGNDVDAAELMSAARNVALAADRFDDEIKQQFGGLSADALSFE
jgi:hypothetical protein